MAKVSLVRVPEKPFDDEVFDAVQTAVDLIGGAGQFAGAGQRVLVKPNWWCWPATTPNDPVHYIYSTADRRIVWAAARLFVDLGCDVVIGEDPAVNRVVRKVYEGFDAAGVAERAGAALVDLRATGYRTVPVLKGREFSELRISTIALDADLIVNVPVLKAHQLTGVTMALKNMKGVLPPVEKRAFHQRNLSQGIADLATVVRPALNIVDAIVAADNWVVGGGLQPTGLVLAGDDPVAIDAVCCHLMKADPYAIEHIRFSHEQGVGEIDLARIDVLGESIDAYALPFTLPADPMAIAADLANIDIVVGEACSSCLNRLGNIFPKIGLEELAQSGEIAFIVGKGAQPIPGKANILMGPCTARHKAEGIYVADCPPMEQDLMHAVRYVAGKETEMRYFWDDEQVFAEDASEQ